MATTTDRPAAAHRVQARWVPTSTGRRFIALLMVVALLGACSANPDSQNASPNHAAPTDRGAEPADGADPNDETDPENDAETENDADPADRDFRLLDSVVADYVEANGMNGAGLIIVDRDAGIVYENYWGAFGPERVTLLASTSKVVSAGVLFHLADQGLLDLDAPVSEQTGWSPDNNQITVAQLLSNSSGLVGLAPNPAYGPYLCQFIPFGTTTDCAKGIYLSPADDADVVAPDTEFRYGGGQWQVAGGVAETVSGKTWSQLIDEIYVEPCGLEEFGYSNHFAMFDGGLSYPTAFTGDVSVLPLDNPSIEGGLYARPGDYAKLLLMHLRGGRCGDTQVLSETAVTRMQEGRVDASVDSPDRRYGYGWWVDPQERVYDPGAYGTVAWIDNSGAHGAYLVAESSGDTVAPLRNQLFGLVDDIMSN